MDRERWEPDRYSQIHVSYDDGMILWMLKYNIWGLTQMVTERKVTE